MYKKLIMLMIVVAAHVAGSECISFEKTVAAVMDAKSGAQLRTSQACFCEVLSKGRRSASELVPLIEKYAASQAIGDTLLFCAWRDEAIRGNASVFAAVLHAWKACNPSVAVRIQQYQQAGAFRKIDTLCSILDRDKNADASLLLRWVETKLVLDDLDAIPDLFCRSIDDKPGVLAFALNQFEMLLHELTSEHAGSLLKRFGECRAADSLINREILQWIIGQYGAKQLFAEQVAAVRSARLDRDSQYELLYEIAQYHFLSHSFRPAADAAHAAYRIDADTVQKKELAGLLFRSYRELGNADSASFWFERSDPLAPENRRESIGIYLGAGDYSAAARRIKEMPESLSRDTLMLRCLLLSDSPAVAYGYAFTENTPLARSPFSAIWRVRTALFNGNIEKCREILDALSILPADPYASEFMEYRYWLMRMSDSQEDLAKFCQIQYTLFKGETVKASQIICGDEVSAQIRWRMAIQTARALIDKSEYAAAVALLRCVPADREPEYLFCLADALYRQNDAQASETLLKRLILEFPSGMYTAQARVLLSRIGK